MKTKIDVRLYAVTNFVLPILQMIANHNAGKTFINLGVLEAHVMALNNTGAYICETRLHREDGMLIISEKLDIVLTVFEKEMLELKEENNIEVKEPNY